MEEEMYLDDKVWDKLTDKQYNTWYQQSIENADEFWAEQANRFISWDRPWSSVSQQNFADAHFSWFKDAQLNVCANCIDRHLTRNAQKPAIIWEPDNVD